MKPWIISSFFMAGLLPLYAQSVPAPDDTVSITAAPPYSATGELYLLRADTNRTLLQNPVLVVEGFDLGNEMNWPELYELLNQESLVEDLQSFGRDLAVLNFGDSTADILANSALTEAAIRAVNSRRADLTDKFTTVGASLGGLTLRKALVDMPDHQADTWISFDGPHEGANIPLGVQEYLEFFASYNPSAEDLLAALDSPASRQLLISHHSHPDGLTGGSQPERSDFITAMNTAGYPTNCKTIAISNGSGFGEKQPFSPGEKIINWTDSGLPSVAAEIFALPQTADPVFIGEVRLIIPIDSATVISYSPPSLDNAPGGARATFYQLFTNIPPDQISADDYCSYTNHCFIPTVSALGIPIDNLESNLSVHADLLALSPFDEIHFGVTNEPHVQINARNKRWLMRAVLEEYDTDGDGYDDYAEYLIGTDYASADSLLTVYAVIEVLLVDSKATLTWNVYPNTRYEVWYAPELGETWLLLETIPPAADPVMIREYLIDTGAATGFFKIGGTPVDPVTD
jgi:hypothetical protein